MNSYKWTRGLSKSTIANVLECQPESVEFRVNHKRKIVACDISTKDGNATGVAICSCLDDFDIKKGKNIAAGRAVIALIDKYSSRFTRSRWEQFPGTWTKKRIMAFRLFDGIPKAIYGGLQSGRMAQSHLNKLLA